jgi:hypothetical protein
MTSNDSHIQHTWTLTRGTGEIVIDLWTDSETVRVEGGDGESSDGGRKAADRLIAKYQAAGYQVTSSYPVNDPHQHDEEAAEEPDGKPEACPECAGSGFDYVPNHTNGLRQGDAWLCTGCRWGQWVVA